MKLKNEFIKNTDSWKKRQQKELRMTHSEIDAIITRYEGKESSILAILQDIQAKEKYLPKETLEHVGERLRIPLNKIYRMATFYRAFSLTPRGFHEVCVCIGTACPGP